MSSRHRTTSTATEQTCTFVTIRAADGVIIQSQQEEELFRFDFCQEMRCAQLFSPSAHVSVFVPELLGAGLLFLSPCFICLYLLRCLSPSCNQTITLITLRGARGNTGCAILLTRLIEPGFRYIWSKSGWLSISDYVKIPSKNKYQNFHKGLWHFFVFWAEQ